MTMALTETVTYYEEEGEEGGWNEEERARVACEPTQAYDSGGETDEGRDRSRIVGGGGGGGGS